MIEIVNAYRENGANCNHIVLEMSLDGSDHREVVVFEKLREQYAELPGGYRGQLLLLMALYELDNGNTINKLYKVRVK